MEESGEPEGAIGEELMACLPHRKNHLVKALALKVHQLAQKPYGKDSVVFGGGSVEDSDPVEE